MLKKTKALRGVAFAALACVAMPAEAGNSLIPAGQKLAVAKSALMVTPGREWNKMGARPGRNSETWTVDGDTLNDLTFYGGIESGRPLFREVSKRVKPLPHFSSTMLLTDLPSLFEQSYRIALGTPLMTIDTVEPVTFSGSSGVHFTYNFTRMGEDVHRKGEANAAVIGGRLYMITFEAPELYYFDKGIASYRDVVRSAALGAVATR